MRFLGSVRPDQLPDLYRRAMAAVFPFRQETSGDQEGFGLVIVEAMGCGCPVVVGDVPAVRQIVRHGKNGVLINPDDTCALADTLARLLGDSHLRRILGQEAHRAAVGRFDWTVSSAAYSGILANLSSASDALGLTASPKERLNK